MARPRRQVRSARERWARERRFARVFDRIHTSIERSLCEHHFEEFPNLDDSLKEVCSLVAEADAIVEEEIGAFFPPCPHHITQDLWQGFKSWLKSDMGSPIRSICKPWYEHVRRSQIVCSYCRGEAAIVVDSGSEIDTEEEDDDAGVVIGEVDAGGDSDA
ncbi:hypothetical protein FRX31_021286 [Thalictrum thalictroides]|uniref:Uncharacterized protein n=1 Tax=Thalictrum thalictroides TaxID=46969 RepID=A0A7J6VWZ5_THATH|nr:hypothetical protein FRX31_021286 [Thalictrum thalictroides]